MELAQAVVGAERVLALGVVLRATAVDDRVGQPREPVEPIVPPPEKNDRTLVPVNEPAELVAEDEFVFLPVEAPSEVVDLQLPLGDPNAIDDMPPGGASTSIGPGKVPGTPGSGLPTPFSVRRDKAGSVNFGRPPRGKLQATQRAVLEALTWLARHQAPDGSWSLVGLRERCTAGRSCISAAAEVQPFYDEGLTALALLAFLGAGLNHDAKQTITDQAMGREYVVGDVVRSGLRWLVQRQKSDGSFSATRAFTYNEALCAMALSEAYGLSTGPGKRAWKRPAQKAVDFLVAAQKKSPEDGAPWGWRYDSRALVEAKKANGEIDDETYFIQVYDADISVTGWVIMALKSARISGLDVPEEALEGGLRFARHVSLPDGLAGYQSPEHAGKKVPGLRDEYDYHPGTMSALSMLVRTFVEHDLEDPFLEEAAKQIVKDLPAVSKDKQSIDYYYWYYGSLALNQFDGPDSPRSTGNYWNPWKKAMEEAVIELQDKNKERDECSRGGWLVDGAWSHAGRALYNTAINVLTLEVYYRYENAFGAGKRDRESSPTPSKERAPGQPR